MSKASKEISVFPSQAGEAARQVVAMSTTFVQTEKESFREVVQRYTGAAGGDDDSLVKLPVTCSNNGTLARKPMHQLLHQRRQKMSKEMKLEIRHTPILFKRNGAASPLSSSSEGFCPLQQLHVDHLLPPLLSSPVTPLSALSLDTSPSVTSIDQPPRGIRLQEGFSQFAPLMPRRKSEPELLNLFPLTSPHAT